MINWIGKIYNRLHPPVPTEPLTSERTQQEARAELYTADLELRAVVEYSGVAQETAARTVREGQTNHFTEILVASFGGR